MIACVILLINANYNNKNNGSSNRNGNEKWKWWRGHQKWHKWNLHPNLNETLHFNQFHSEEQFDWLRFQNGWIKDFQVLRAMAHLLGNFHFHANFNIFKIQSEILRCFDFGLKACVCVCAYATYIEIVKINYSPHANHFRL